MNNTVIKIQPAKWAEFTDTQNIIGYDVVEFVFDLFDLLAQIFNKTNEFPGLNINADSAYDDIRDENSIALRYKIISRSYGQFDSNSPGKGNIKSIKWRKIDELNDPKFPQHKVVIKKQIFDTIIELGVWSKNYSDVNKFAFRIEDLIEEYSPVFAKKGLDEVRFIERKEDNTKEIGGTLWYNAPLIYLVRTHKFKREFERNLAEVIIEKKVVF